MSEARTVVADTAAVALGFSFQVQFEDRRIMTAQTHVPQDADPAQINAVLDKLADAVDRIEARYRERQLARQLVQETRLRREAAEQADRIEQKAKDGYADNPRRGPYKMSQTEQAAKDNLEKTMARHDLIIGDVQEELAECRGKLNGAGAGA